PATTGEAALAVQVGLHRTAIADTNVSHAGPDRQHLNPELVPWNARVAVERHLPEVAADVCTTDADAVNADQRLARPGLGWLVDLNLLDPPGLYKLNGLHGRVSDHTRPTSSARRPVILRRTRASHNRTGLESERGAGRDRPPAQIPPERA